MARVITIETIETPSLGDRSYLVHDGHVAVIIDPQRDIDRILELASAAGVSITHVFETHLHNDYVTGGLALARATGAAYVVADAEEVAFERVPAADGTRISTGDLAVTAVATPGHTPHHLSYIVAEADGEPVAVFTGGSMLFGAVGRTDLAGSDRTDELTRAQYRSVRRLAAALPASSSVHPTHGFGSFCAATPTSGSSSTIGHERGANIALTVDDEDTFVDRLVAGLAAHPGYYAHMGPLNAAGPGGPQLGEPRSMDPAELRRRVLDGEWVVDLRDRRAFAHHHVAGTISVELGNSFVTFLGWTMRWGTPLTLVAERSEHILEARRQLTRIGIDRLEGAATGHVDSLAAGQTASYDLTDFDGLAAAMGTSELVVLDVRRPDEWAAGHIAGAVHIPLWELEGEMAAVPDGVVWVHCASGFRASIAASLLERAGRRVVHIDDDWDRAQSAGLPMVR